ncbi:hypothetical protein WJX73_007689 [Symbiochloris irregularis]|uniref:Protein-serine/threonine kinase n=1 Tax=Symbiochloris irregularis TaxID=706552 RepID=A0AAW1Q0C1_9CHLO
MRAQRALRRSLAAEGGWRAPFRCIWGDGSPAQDSNASSRFYDHSIEEYASQDVEVLSLSQMLQFGRRAVHDRTLILKSARMIQRELPKRLARRLMDLQFLPHIVVTNPHIKLVYDSYYHAFATLRDMAPVTGFEDNAALDALLRRLLDEHAPMLDALARGLRECRSKAFVGDKLQLDSFLDGMLRSRISRRVLAEQHLHLGQSRQDFIGVIATHLQIADALDHAIQQARQVCTETYGRAPRVVITGAAHATLAYIPNHLDYMLFELLKNGMRAVVERYAPLERGASEPLPPLYIRIANAESCITLRLSDQGGGIAEEELVWRWGFTTMPPDGALPQDLRGQEEGWSNPVQMQQSRSLLSPMAGLGFGLPLSRLHAQYFGGDLVLGSPRRMRRPQWDQLAPELLTKVMAHLPFRDKLCAELSCRSWHSVLSDPQGGLWGDVHLGIEKLSSTVDRARNHGQPGSDLQLFLPMCRWLSSRASAGSLASLHLVTVPLEVHINLQGLEEDSDHGRAYYN